MAWYLVKHRDFTSTLPHKSAGTVPQNWPWPPPSTSFPNQHSQPRHITNVTGKTPLKKQIIVTVVRYRYEKLFSGCCDMEYLYLMDIFNFTGRQWHNQPPKRRIHFHTANGPPKKILPRRKQNTWQIWYERCILSSAELYIHTGPLGPSHAPNQLIDMVIISFVTGVGCNCKKRRNTTPFIHYTNSF
jgi:hypothetical protein